MITTTLYDDMVRTIVSPLVLKKFDKTIKEISTDILNSVGLKHTDLNWSSKKNPNYNTETIEFEFFEDNTNMLYKLLINEEQFKFKHMDIGVNSLDDKHIESVLIMTPINIGVEFVKFVKQCKQSRNGRK